MGKQEQGRTNGSGRSDVERGPGRFKRAGPVLNERILATMRH